MPHVRGKGPLLATFAVVLAGLLWYSQNGAYAWDEGFHLLSAQLITRGKTPYIDFFFPQTPLNSYWNAFWMKLFGDTWRTAHAVAAAMSAASAYLLADFFLERARNLTLAITVLLLCGANAMVVQFGPVGQAYGLCLLLLVLSFRLSVRATEQDSVLPSLGTGLLTSACASASLLTAPAIPVLFAWVLFADKTGAMWRKTLAFAAGSLAGLGPVLFLIAKDPQRVFFQLVLYNLRYRTAAWDDVAGHDIGVLLGSIDSAQALVLGLCGTFGFYVAWRTERLPAALRAPCLLCGFLGAAMALHIATAHPTFERYFLFLTPSFAFLTGAALLAVPRADRRIPITIALALTALGLGKSLYDERDSFNWGIWQEISRKVDEVTPRGAAVQADEHVYLITRRTPPEGMEHENSHKPLPLTLEQRRRLHILSKSDLETQIRAGAYATIATCDDTKPVAQQIIQPLYRDKWELEQCTVYWNFKR